jgi:hypothetical protein
MKKRRSQPSPVEVLFRRSREGRAGVLGRRHEGDGEKRRSRKNDGLKTEPPFTKNQTNHFFERSDQTDLFA